MHDNHDSLSVRAFVRHLVEMLVAMGVGMTLLGLLDTAILRAIGLGALREQPLLDLALMSVEMTLPMAGWMIVRGHGRRDTTEMSLSMLVPAAVLWLLGAGGIIGAMDAEMAYHPIMLVAMVGLMVVRRHVYAAGHHVHGGRDAHEAAGARDQPRMAAPANVAS